MTLTKNLKFIAVTAWILFSRSYDAYCTHTLTPDLSKEVNPLVTVGGVSSWSVLIVILSRCLVFAGIVSTTMWILIHNSEYYRSVHSAPIVYSILIAGCLGIVYQWNKAEYARYLV